MHEIGGDNDGLIDHGNIERSEIDDDREALIDQPARQRAVEHRGVDPASLERLADQHRIADHQYTDIVALNVEPTCSRRRIVCIQVLPPML